MCVRNIFTDKLSTQAPHMYVHMYIHWLKSYVIADLYESSKNMLNKHNCWAARVENNMKWSALNLNLKLFWIEFENRKNTSNAGQEMAEENRSPQNKIILPVSTAKISATTPKKFSRANIPLGAKGAEGLNDKKAKEKSVNKINCQKLIIGKIGVKKTLFRFTKLIGNSHFVKKR